MGGAPSHVFSILPQKKGKGKPRQGLPLPLFAMLSRCGLAALPGRFRSASGKTRLRCAAAGLSPSLRYKLPCAAILRASGLSRCAPSATAAKPLRLRAPFSGPAGRKAVHSAPCLSRLLPGAPRFLFILYHQHVNDPGHLAAQLALHLKAAEGLDGVAEHDLALVHVDLKLPLQLLGDLLAGDGAEQLAADRKSVV